MLISLRNLLFGIALLAPAVSVAMPVVSVYEDELLLYANTRVNTIDDVTVSHTAYYQGSLLPSDRTARVDNWVLEEPCGPGGTACGDEIGHSARAEASIGSNSLHLFTYSLFYWAPSPLPPETLPVWDMVTDPVQNSLAYLNWVFSVDQDLTLDTYFVKNSGIGLRAGLLVDTTTNTTVMSFLGGAGFDSFQDLALTAGHKYMLKLAAADLDHDDDTESYIDLYFSEDVVFMSVPEPEAVLLFLFGLVMLGLTRARSISNK